VGAAVIDHPKHPLRRRVRLDGHDLLHQASERLDPGGGLAAAEQPPPVDLPRGEIGQRAATVVLVLDPHDPGPAGWQGRVAAAARLDGGLLIRRDDVLARAQPLALEHPGVQVQHPGGLGGEVGVAGEDPGAMLPRLDGILGKPAPHRRGRHLGGQAAGHDLGAQLGQAPAADRHASGGGQLAGDRRDLGDHRRREHPGATRAGPVPQPRIPVGAEPLAPLADRVGRHPDPPGDQHAG
jgi:hypothetical protein